MHFDRHCTMSPWAVLARTRTLLAAGCLSLCQGCTQMASSASVASASSLVSSASSLELISSPFRSSSRSQGEPRQEEQRQQEIEGYIIVLLRGGPGDRQAFYRGLAGIAARFGVGDWEAEPGTWLAVGRGLAGAGLGAAAAAERAQRWSAGDAQKAALVMRGYEAGREWQCRQTLQLSQGGASTCHVTI